MIGTVLISVIFHGVKAGYCRNLKDNLEDTNGKTTKGPLDLQPWTFWRLILFVYIWHL